MNSFIQTNSTYSFFLKKDIGSLNFDKKNIEIKDMKLILEEINSFLNLSETPIFLSVKMAKECIISSSARDMLASFFTSEGIKKVAFLAKNRHQMTVGNLLVNSCKKNVAIKLCVFDIEVNEWLAD